MNKKAEKAKNQKLIDLNKETPEQRKERVRNEGSSHVTKVIPNKKKSKLREIKDAEAKREKYQ